MEELNYEKELLAGGVDIKDVKEILGEVIAIVEFDFQERCCGEVIDSTRRTSVVFIYDDKYDGFEFDTSLVYKKVYEWVKENHLRVLGRQVDG